jgi:hypothetical protein
MAVRGARRHDSRPAKYRLSLWGRVEPPLEARRQENNEPNESYDIFPISELARPGAV